ncbi:DUF2891 domain-containing protein [Phenylobacterium sp. J426]|uniref:DUF2891 domain-containing protein n=1 Tax=Phenylobacterium sp. J426 TaxID=2898439 RepID=UPI002151F8CA|nr:DUF2891 domain-containing protein [Phenylobacterium sp. J426]MCR5875804.1 DUF2891 domain-containing protein [Phenylobacterium sp. J426]
MSSPSEPPAGVTAELASSFARIALGHVAREYPNKLDHVLDGPDDAKGPRALHPIYFGSFDWHSCVHGYWTLATCLRLFPDMPEATAIRARFDAAFTRENVAAEVAYLGRASARGFERPYGWGWLLKLQAELLAHQDQPWARLHQPLADAFVVRFSDFLPNATYPIRTGVHSSTSFAIALAADYARLRNPALLELFTRKMRAWHAQDRDAPAWEPSLDEFLSATLTTAECLRRLLPPDEFAAWFAAYLPHIADGRPETLFTPAVVSDRTDGKIVHLDGLNLSRAWCWRALAPTLSGAARVAAEQAADRHLAASLPHVAGDYMGEHWLASFALLALTA